MVFTEQNATSFKQHICTASLTQWLFCCHARVAFSDSFAGLLSKLLQSNFKPHNFCIFYGTPKSKQADAAYYQLPHQNHSYNTLK